MKAQVTTAELLAEGWPQPEIRSSGPPRDGFKTPVSSPPAPQKQAISPATPAAPATPPSAYVPPHLRARASAVNTRESGGLSASLNAPASSAQNSRPAPAAAPTKLIWAVPEATTAWRAPSRRDSAFTATDTLVDDPDSMASRDEDVARRLQMEEYGVDNEEEVRIDRDRMPSHASTHCSKGLEMEKQLLQQCQARVVEEPDTVPQEAYERHVKIQQIVWMEEELLVEPYQRANEEFLNSLDSRSFDQTYKRTQADHQKWWEGRYRKALDIQKMEEEINIKERRAKVEEMMAMDAAELDRFYAKVESAWQLAAFTAHEREMYGVDGLQSKAPKMNVSPEDFLESDAGDSSFGSDRAVFSDDSNDEDEDDDDDDDDAGIIVYKGVGRK